MIRYSRDYMYEIRQHKDLGDLKITGDGVFQWIHYYCVVSKYFFIQSKLTTSTFLLHTTRLCFKSPKSPKPTASNCLYLWLPKSFGGTPQCFYVLKSRARHKVACRTCIVNTAPLWFTENIRHPVWILSIAISIIDLNVHRWFTVKQMYSQ